MKNYKIIISIFILGVCTLATVLFKSQSAKDELASDQWTTEIRQCDSLIADLAERRDNVSSPSLMGDVEGDMINILHRKDSVTMIIYASSGDDEYKTLVNAEYEAWVHLKAVLMDFVTNAIEVKYWNDPWRYVYGWYFEEDVLNLHLDSYYEISEPVKTDYDVDEQKTRILELCNKILISIMDVTDETDDLVSMQYVGRIDYAKECVSKAIKQLTRTLDNWVETSTQMRGKELTARFLDDLYGIIKEDTK